MSAPTDQRQRLRRRPAGPAAERRSGAVRARRGAAVGHRAARADHRRAPQRRGLLPREPRAHLPGDARPAQHGRARRRPDARRAPQAGGGPGERRRRGDDRAARRLGPRGRQPAPVRADRARERDAAPAAARGLRDPEPGAQPRGAAARPRGHGRARDPRGRPRGLAQGLPLRRAAAGRRARQAAEALARGQPDDGHAVRLRGPGHDHGRLPARQPDHPRRAPLDGQVGADGQLRRERRAGLQQGRRAVQPRDGRGRARPALHRQPGVDQGRRPAQGPRPAVALGQDPAGLLAAGELQALRRRLVATSPSSTCARSAAGSRSRTRTGSGWC